MTSIYSADNPYYVEGPGINIPYKYTKGTVMDFVYKDSPLFALFLQRISADRNFDKSDLYLTCFVPEKMYSSRYFDYFDSISNFYFCEKAVFNACIRGNISKDNLKTEERIPNLLDNFITISCCGENIFVDGLKILYSVNCSNGIVHVLEGMIGINEEFISG